MKASVGSSTLPASAAPHALVTVLAIRESREWRANGVLVNQRCFEVKVRI